MNIFPNLKNLTKQVNEILFKRTTAETPVEKVANNIQQNKPNPGQSLINTNSNVVINQPVLNNPVTNQAALNASNLNQPNLNFDVRNSLNLQIKQTPNQLEFRGPTDLPVYAGISNMSLKSWIAQQDNKSFTNLESNEKQLAVTLEGIKGFERKSFENPDGESSGRGKGFTQSRKNKNLLIFSSIFSNIEQNAVQETELLVTFNNFKKLGSNIKDSDSGSEEGEKELKSAPPLPNELHKLENINLSQIKFLHQLIALPDSFPECLRFFAKENIEINPHDVKIFLEQRLKFVQEQLFGSDSSLNKTIENYTLLLNQNNYSIFLPLVLLYYPLPIPFIKPNQQVFEWREKKDKKPDREKLVIASCEIYYVSNNMDRFLIKFELSHNNELTCNIETSQTNEVVVHDIEAAVAQSMFLLRDPPLLSELNVSLAKEIYEATDNNEELSIISSGPIRLELILAAYVTLLTLNKYSSDFAPAGLIDMSD